MRTNRPLKSQSGQMILEAILLMTLFLSIAILIKREVGDKNIVGAMVAGPWNQVSGMISNGVWQPEAAGRPHHPQGNIVSREGDTQPVSAP